MFFIDKETRNKIKEEKRRLVWEAKKKKELLNANIDYNFLQTLIDRCANNSDLEIEIFFKSGDRMKLRQKQSQTNYNYQGYTGEATIEEMR